jgi:mitogen-activated protein kinase 1/3
MLTFKEYTRAIDIWSVGCVLAEMLNGKPLFPGRDCASIPPPLTSPIIFNNNNLSRNYRLDHHQLSIILDVLGTPSIDDFYAITSQRSRDYIRALPFRKKKPFAQMFPDANPDAVDLLEKCLTFSPRTRITVEEALQHPYLAVRLVLSSHSSTLP